MLKTVLIILCIVVIIPLAFCSLSLIGVGVGVVKTVSVVQEGLHQKLEQKGQVTQTPAQTPAQMPAQTPIPAQTPAQAPVGSAWTNADSDWTKGLRWCLQNGQSATCDAPPIGIANPADWSLGCRSGQKGHH